MAEGKRNIGFARLPPYERHEMAVKGGEAVKGSKKHRKWTPEEAREAGRKGGLSSRGGRKKALLEG